LRGGRKNRSGAACVALGGRVKPGHDEYLFGGGA
jgi:hypothetical protein